MTHPTITQVIQQCSLSDESRLNALALFSLLRPSLNCNFAAFLRYLDGPGRADVVAFTQAMQVTQKPVKEQVILLASYLDFLESGQALTLQQFSDALMNQMRHVEEEQFVDRVVQGKPQGGIVPLPEGAPTVPHTQIGHAIGNVQGILRADLGMTTPQAPSTPPAPAGPGGWGAFTAPPPPGPQAPQPLQVPQSQLPAQAAVSVPAGDPSIAPFDGGSFPAMPTGLMEKVDAVAAEINGWVLAGQAANAPPKEADIPEADPLPEWFRPGTRARYELGDQKVLVTVSKVAGRHATIVADDGTTWHNVAHAYLEDATGTPYEMEFAIPAYRMKELEDMTAKTVAYMKPQMLAPVVDFVRVSPLDGGKLHLGLELWASADAAAPFFYCFRAQSAGLDELASTKNPVLLPDWTVQLEQAVYHLHLIFAAPEPDAEAAAPETPAPAKRTRAPRKKSTKAV